MNISNNKAVKDEVKCIIFLKTAVKTKICVKIQNHDGGIKTWF